MILLDIYNLLPYRLIFLLWLLEDIVPYYVAHMEYEESFYAPFV